MQERWLSVHEIAAHLGVNRDTIYKCRCPPTRLGASGSSSYPRWMRGWRRGRQLKERSKS